MRFNGLLAGVIGAVVWLLVSIVLNVVMAPIQERLATELVRVARDLPPEVRTSSNRSEPHRRSGYVFDFVLLLCAGGIFATLGGVLGAAFFRNDVPPALGGPLPPPPLPPSKTWAGPALGPGIALRVVFCYAMAQNAAARDRRPASRGPYVSAVEEFGAQATIDDEDVYARAERDPEAFWAGFAEELEWFSQWTQVLDWNPPHAKWFIGGTLNASVNCVDRHVRGPRRNKAAIVWEGEPGDRRTLTYFDLYRQVSQFANVLKSLGVKRGDRVAIYLPLIPELAIAMLACARIGAVHSVVFGGFSSESLRDRINDAQCTLLITADGGWRRGQVVPSEADGRRSARGHAVHQARRSSCSACTARRSKSTSRKAATTGTTV